MAHAGPVIERVVSKHPPIRAQSVAAGTDINIAFAVVGEVPTQEGAVVALALFPDRDVRIDAALDQATQRLAGAVIPRPSSCVC